MAGTSSFRIAIRKFGPFETAIEKIWQSFTEGTRDSALRLEAEALDLNPLHETLVTRQGLKDGRWDVAFMVTDWLAEAVENGLVLDLAPYMAREPMPDYPQGWVPSLVRFQHWGDAVCEQPSCLVKGKVAIGELPTADQQQSVSLSVYWTLVIGSGSRHKDEAYAFLRHACSPEMDKLTTMEGAIGCRLSTWQDPDVNAAIPFYHRLADLTPGARTLPRSRHFPALAQVLDDMVQQAIRTDAPTQEIVRAAQHEARGISL